MSIQESIRYGATELKRIYNRNLGLALAISVGAHLIIIGLYIFGTNIGKGDTDKKTAPVAKMALTNLAAPPVDENVPPPPPPPMIPEVMQSAGSGTGGVASRAGNPIPVPDALIAPDVKFAATTELSVARPEQGDGTGFGGMDGTGLGAPVPMGEKVEVKVKEEYPDVDAFLPDATDPGFDMGDIQRRAIYPEMARKNGIEGKVIVRVLVDKKGKPVNHRIDYSDNKILEKSAVAAVMGTSFSPGVQNGTPVAVWVSIPVSYSLN